MSARAVCAVCLALVLTAVPVAAQDQDPDPAPLQGWPPEGWTVAPLDDLPPMELETGPIEIVPQPREGDPALEMYDTPRENGVMLDIDPPATPEIVTATAADGAVLRGLDRVSGARVDLTLAPGETGQVGRLRVTLGECRYPADNPASDAYAYLTIFEEDGTAPVFSGWMLASSPALNALDHPRFDVWVLRCNMS